jgi:hypothetical protein
MNRKKDLYLLSEQYTKVCESAIDPMHAEWAKAAQWYFKKYGQLPGKSVRFNRRGGPFGVTYEVAQDQNNEDAKDASAVNMEPGGVLEIQPDGQHPDAPAKDENAEDLSAQLDPETGEAEDWRQQLYRAIETHAEEFLGSVYELGYTGEAGERDIEYLVNRINTAIIDGGDQETANALRVLISDQISNGAMDM